MDRFTYSIFATLIAVIVAGVIALMIPRHREPAEVAAPPVAVADPPPLVAGTPDPQKLFESPGAAMPLAQNPPLATNTGTPLAAAPAFAMPTPVPWNPPNHGKVTTVIYPGFTVVYSLTLGNPLAVQYAMVNGAKPKRYPPPVGVQTPRPTLIEAAGYQRGEMALSESITLYFGKASGRNTGLMTNLCAFNPACLAGPWAQFAAMEKRYAGDFFVPTREGRERAVDPGCLFPRLPPGVWRHDGLHHSADGDLHEPGSVSDQHCQRRGGQRSRNFRKHRPSRRARARRRGGVVRRGSDRFLAVA